MKDVITVCGSLRRASIHAALLDAAEAQIIATGASAERDDVGSIPHYDQDLDDPPPAEIAARRSRVAAADGVLLACPAYNGTVTGAMKDWIDWISRPFGQSALRGTPLAIVTASPGSKGGVQAATYLERITRSLGATLVAEPLTIPDATSLFDDDGRLGDDGVRASLHHLVSVLLNPPDR